MLYSDIRVILFNKLSTPKSSYKMEKTFFSFKSNGDNYLWVFGSGKSNFRAYNTNCVFRTNDFVTNNHT